MYYKLTNQKMQTHNNFQWELHKWYEVPKENQGGDLCSSSFFHCYSHPLLAVLLNPIHTNFDNPRLFEIEVGGNSQENNGLKFGFTRMKLIKEIELPEITIEQKTKFAILCALEVYHKKDFVEWANNWLSGKRSIKPAWAADDAAADAAVKAADAAAWAADDAADDAADAAADAAAWAAAAADDDADDWVAVRAADAAAWAAAAADDDADDWVAVRAADAAAWAADAAYIDLISLAEKAIKND